MDSVTIEYINEDEQFLAPGRHAAEFKHIFEHFTMAAPEKNKKEEDRKTHLQDSGKDAF
jgi:hypothetical protein